MRLDKLEELSGLWVKEGFDFKLLENLRKKVLVLNIRGKIIL